MSPWAVVGPEEAGHAAQDERNGECVDDAGRGQPPRNLDRQALPAELVEYVQRPEGFAAIGPTRNEVIAPDMVRVLGPETNT